MTAVRPAPTGAPRAADFLARHRGGGLFTETVNQRIGAYLNVVAYRLDLAPTVLTLANLAIGMATSITVAWAAPAMADGRVSAALIGAIAMVGWHLAYSLDCADGQLARVTGKMGPAGGRVDILADVAQQISVVSAVTAVAHAYSPDMPAWVGATFAGTWMVNLVTSVLQQGSAASSLVVSRSPLVRMIKLVRDYGAVITVVSGVILFVPATTVWLMAVFTLGNGAFLLASVAAAARASLRP